ncbi:MAG: excinuclease ABC subunit UvrC [Bacteroidales bacterium]|jgi:excinuclease ABC subunit C|nr:excinuclease ABC subunit UvrC [Bacteroidales bacterium]
MSPRNQHIDQLDLQIRSLPQSPGVYQYFDDQNRIIYVGKAKDLKKRVASYFNKEKSASGKLRVLVSKIARIEFMVVDTELDALLLENNLIKKYQPRYNILLKDDKTFPWICVKNEPFPRIFSTRNLITDGSEYFGPYASGKMMHTILDLVRQLYPIRSCKLQLNKHNIAAGKFTVCLDYHIGKCLGPCVGKQSEEEYLESIQEIRNIIKGDIVSVISNLKGKMMVYAKELKFEKAQLLKERIDILTSYRSKSLVVNPKIHNVDVFSFILEQESAFVNFLKIINGAIVQTHTIELKKRLDETNVQLLEMAMAELYSRFGSNSIEIILPFKIELSFPNSKITIPQKGDKKQLLDLSMRNARFYQLERQKRKDLVDPNRHSKRILQQLQEDLRMDVLPEHIECFDNSNLQGDYPVAAMVMFKNAKPYKKGYRHYNIKTVEGPDDFHSMEEVVYRRYKRLLDEKEHLPQLIVVDGGKGQLSASVRSLEKLDLRGKITIIGIAKKLEEIYFPDDSLPLYINKKSESLKLIQQLRDEAHRFGITHHRNKRDKGTLKTELTEIKGIGTQTANHLLREFGSVTKIKKQDKDSISTVIGQAKARIIFEYFQKKA